MTVQKFQRKPQDAEEVQYAARYHPGETLEDLYTVARMNDPDVVLQEVDYCTRLFRSIAGPYLVVLFVRVPDERAAEVDILLVKPGDYLAYTPRLDFLYDSDGDNWDQFYTLVPE